MLVAPPALAEVVRNDLLDGNATEVRTARLVRFSAWGTAANGDIVLVKDGRSFLAGLLWRSCTAAGRTVCLIQLANYTEWD